MGDQQQEETTDCYNEDFILKAMNNIKDKNLEKSLQAIKYLQDVMCKTPDYEPHNPIVQHLLEFMRGLYVPSGNQLVDACIDAIHAFCLEGNRDPLVFIFNAQDVPQESYEFLPLDRESIFCGLKRRYGRQLFEYMYGEMTRYDSENMQAYRYHHRICYTFKRSEIIEFDALQRMTEFCWQKFDDRFFIDHMLNYDLVDYEKILDYILRNIPDSRWVRHVPIHFSDFEQTVRFLIEKANKYREKNAQSDEKMKQNIDTYLKLLTPFKMLDAAENLHRNKVLSDEEMKNIKKRFNKFPSFEKSWLKSDEDAPENVLKAEEVENDNSEQTLYSYFSSFFL